MAMTRSEIMRKGMDCLTREMGIIQAEEFISLIIRERSDYTEWQRVYFDGMTLEELDQEAVRYEEAHPFDGDAVHV